MTAWQVLVGLCVLSFVVSAHEFGHLLVTKWFRFPVAAFSIGMGPVLLRKRIGSTEFRLSLIPMGGYVMSIGSLREFYRKFKKTLPANVAAEFKARKRWMEDASAGEAFLIAAAGPIASFVFGIILMTGAAWLTGKEEPTSALTVQKVEPGSRAEAAGVMAGDVILTANGQPAITAGHLLLEALMTGDKELSLHLTRNGKELDIVFAPAEKASARSIPELGMLLEQQTRHVDLSVAGSFVEGLRMAWDLAVMTGRTVSRLVTGRMAMDALSGPVGITEMSGKFAALGPVAALKVGGLLSLTLGLINVLPLLPMDGGLMVVATYFGLIGRMPARPVLIGYQLAGLAVMAFALIMGTYFDISAHL